MFTGRRFDFETGLYYYRARYYNPYIGHFLQTDPVGYGYAYCSNNPLTNVDPSGLLETTATIPTDAITDDPSIADPWADIAIIEFWLENIGFSDSSSYPEWMVIGLDIVDGKYKITFGTRPGFDESKAVMPKFTVFEIMLCSGPNYKNGLPAGKVPVVSLPDRYGFELLRLDDRTLNRIIAPTIKGLDLVAEAYNQLPQIVQNPLEDLFMTYGWDSWFCDKDYYTFYYDHHLYSGSEINYIVGGYVAHRFGWEWPAAFGWVIGSKAIPPRFHFPWEKYEVRGTYYWFTRGYWGLQSN